MRLALLSNVTVDLLASKLTKLADVYLPAGYDTWQQEAMMPSSGLYQQAPEVVVVLLHANAIERVWLDIDKGSQLIDEWCTAVSSITRNLPGVPVFVSTIDISDVDCHYGAEISLGRFFENYLVEAIQSLHGSGNSVYLLPVKDAITDLGRHAFYSPKMWYVGSMPYSLKGLSALTELISRFALAAKGSKKKCIAVDLDNTLWGGVIGEDGVEGIELSDNKEGARYKDTQRRLKKMKDNGVMIAILSKNNVEDVEPVFSHPDMILQHEDFVAEVINWNAKSENIRQLSVDLNIGLDSFVFLDDNPAERERMRAECPDVTVIEFPNDSSQLPSVVSKAYDDYFFSLEVTAEDAEKTAMYRAEKKRKDEQAYSSSPDAFLSNLEMTMTIHLMTPAEEKRVTQLINKTNQFNVTTKRYSEEEIRALAKNESSDVVTVHLRDKYGDQGLVAVVVIKHEDGICEIDSFLMSCRVMGRAAEIEIMAQLKTMLLQRGLDGVRAKYIKTAKNNPVSSLYETLGFSVVSDDAHDVGGEKTYEAHLDDLPDSTGFFAIKEAWV